MEDSIKSCYSVVGAVSPVTGFCSIIWDKAQESKTKKGKKRKKKKKTSHEAPSLQDGIEENGMNVNQKFVIGLLLQGLVDFFFFDLVFDQIVFLLHTIDVP